MADGPVPSDALEPWELVATGTRGVRSRLWRSYCDGLHADLLARWLEPARAGLKTDLFDEAVGEGLVGMLATKWEAVHGIDIAEPVVTAARHRHPGLIADVGDIRALPYPDGSFDAVVSNSTLDHLSRTEEIEAALGEIARVLAPGGRLLITLDNLANPVIRLRSSLDTPLLHDLGLVAFPVGKTFSRPGLIGAVERAGFTVEGSGLLMHVPRILGVWACDIAGRLGGSGRRLLPVLRSAERLDGLFTRDRTGYYAVVYATRRGL